MKSWGLLASCFLFSVVSQAAGLPTATIQNLLSQYIWDTEGKLLPYSEINSDQVNWRLLSKDENAAYRAIGQFIPVNCTATVIDTGIETPDTPAYALTAAHCIMKNGDALPFDQIFTDLPLEGDPVLQLNYFKNADRLAIPVRRAVYAALKNTDLAILELDATYADLLKLGVKGMRLSTMRPSPGTLVETVGVPRRMGRYRITDDVSLRVSSCKLDHFEAFAEYGVIGPQGAIFADKIFLNDHVVAHTCSVARGNSGGPLVNSGGEIVAIATLAALPPEEVKVDTFRKSPIIFNLATEVSSISGCFRDGVFELSLTSCLLERPCNGDRDCLKKRCDGGDYRACRDLALSDKANAASWYGKACDLGDAFSCYSVRPVTIVRFQKACDLGFVHACSYLASYLGTVKEDNDGAMAKARLVYLAKACTFGDSNSCWILADRCQSAQAVATKPEACATDVQVLRITSCALNWHSACPFLDADGNLNQK